MPSCRVVLKRGTGFEVVPLLSRPETRYQTRVQCRVDTTASRVKDRVSGVCYGVDKLIRINLIPGIVGRCDQIMGRDLAGSTSVIAEKTSSRSLKSPVLVIVLARRRPYLLKVTCGYLDIHILRIGRPR